MATYLLQEFTLTVKNKDGNGLFSYTVGHVNPLWRRYPRVHGRQHGWGRKHDSPKYRFSTGTPVGLLQSPESSLLQKTRCDIRGTLSPN